MNTRGLSIDNTNAGYYFRVVNPLKIYYPIKCVPMKAELLLTPKVPGKIMVKLAFLGVVLMSGVYMFVQLLNTVISLF